MTEPEREILLANALAEFLDRRAHGEDLDSAAFCAAHPLLAPDLQLQIEAATEFDQLTEPELESPQHDPLPESLSGYRILRELGSGGMGRVFLASDPRLGREVAVKTLKSAFLADSALRLRFLDEARAMARIAHPNVVRIYELGAETELPHFVMEYVPGAPLTHAARRLDLRPRIELFRKVVAAVEFLHDNGILHRDLKPANVLVDSNLEPRLLDFGLALPITDRHRLTSPGQVLGTPAYLSPEQAAGRLDLDARSDVFALGAILYELLTGELPFPSQPLPAQLLAIREHDPVLPRKHAPTIPGALQNICLKALEKEPADRYPSAQALREDLDRFLAGEPVLAAPKTYQRLLSAQRQRHIDDLDSWHRDHLISDAEYDSLRRNYDRLIERDDSWILEARRLSLSQVLLYLGAWLLTVAAAIAVSLRVSGLSGAPAILAVASVAVVCALAGTRLWRQGNLRIGIAFLLALCALLPLAALSAMTEAGLLAARVSGREWIAAFPAADGWKPLTNAQLWWAAALSLPVCLWLRRFTSSSVFSMAAAAGLCALSLVTLLRLGWLEWMEKDPGLLYFHLLPVALIFFLVAFLLERAARPLDSRYFYPFAVALSYIALSGVALFHEPYSKWLRDAAPWTRGQIEYLFLINSAVYFVLQSLCDRIPTPQMRSVAKAFRFVLPGHVLVSLLLLAIAASAKPEYQSEKRAFDLLLPAAAAAFVLLSIPKQMKNFFVSGLLFLAIGLVRLQQDLWRDRGLWPLALLLLGLLFMGVAAQFTRVKLFVRRYCNPRF